MADGLSLGIEFIQVSSFRWQRLQAAKGIGIAGATAPAPPPMRRRDRIAAGNAGKSVKQTRSANECRVRNRSSNAANW